MQNWGTEYAANHGGLNPFQLMWRDTWEWDRDHAGFSEFAASEPDVERIWEAGQLSDEGKYSEAFQIFLELAESGSVWSMFEVGRCYDIGLGVTRDDSEREQWYYRAFKGGSQLAMLKCAEIAALRCDYELCDDILKVGVGQDWPPALFWLAWYRHKQSESRATYNSIRPLLKSAAKRGHPAARCFLAHFMVRGKFGRLWVPIGFLLVARWSFQFNSGRKLPMKVV